MTDQIPTSRRRQRAENPNIDNLPANMNDLPYQPQDNNDDSNDIPKSQLNKVWKTRGYMAWLSLLSIIIFTGLLFVVDDPQKLELLTSVMTWFYGAMATVVGVYMGLRTWAMFRGK